jgi:two-component system, response regulator YesN
VTGRVLVVEDNAAFRENIVETLSSEAPWVTVSTACNGKEALALLQAGEEPSLALVDLSMPVMTGTQFLDELRARELAQEMCIVIVSGFVEQARDVQYPGIVGMLPKPFKTAELMRFVVAVCPPSD